MPLPITDAAWLMVESAETPQHVGVLMVFEYPEGADDGWVRHLYERFGTARDITWPFNQRLKHPYGRFKLYAWETDPAIDLDYHLRLSALPAPGRPRELLIHVSRLHSVMLDRTRPLWEIHLIDQIAPEPPSDVPRFAMYAKFHHSVFDGVGAMRVMRRMFSEDPDQRDMAPPWQTSTRAQRVPRDNVLDVVDPRGVTIASARQGIATTARTMLDQFRDRRDGVTNEALPFVAPRSILNTRITGARRFAADGWSFDRMLAASTALGVSLNDIVVAMSGHALRAYLLERDALPQQPLTAMIPVNIRDEHEDAGGNALSFVVADLGTNLEDPGDRLRRISESIADAKRRLLAMGRVERITYGLAIASPYLIGPLIGLAGHGPPPMNIVVSNVPGPENTHYLDGAVLRGIYPASVLEQGQALNITMTSYDGEMQFGLTACRRNLPHVQSMLGYLEDGLAALEALV
ncbi:WS/DGAT/MGAT family O-acyltransferase [Euzebya tangerina]|uniref:WS/DGAT/MGAT family O-acyltransferase n=1 Tax=Euzebya tangerina TaxID=591198 RepID=UPI000E320EBF|nr:wax ester/triacylglycerol synthase family O-acyltransferase [Euzebya tangerina]